MTGPAEERAVIAACLADPARSVPAAMAAGVHADWFSDDDLRVIWLAVDALWRRGRIGESDALSIAEEAKRISADPEIQKKFAARVTDETVMELLDDRMIGSTVSGHAAELRSKVLERRVRAAMAQASASFAHAAPEQVALDLRTAIDSALSGQFPGKKIDCARVFAEIMGEYREAYERRTVGGDLKWTPGINLPWPPMTAMMGGLEPGLGIIAARPSVGKTLFALNLIRFWCDSGYRVIFNTLDMQSKSLLRRFISERARVSIKKARYTPTRTDLDAMQSAVDACNKYPLTAVSMKDVDEFRTFCAVEKAAGRCDIVVVDYLGLLHSRVVDNGNEYARVSYCSDALKNLSNDLGVPVIALCQLNREVAKADSNREPGLVDLRGSGSIEQDAFWVILLHRQDDVVNGTWREKPPLQLVPPGASTKTLHALDSVFAILCKAQNGELGKLPFVFRKNYLTASLADFTAVPVARTEGHGVTARRGYDYTACFARVCTDWRQDPLEQVLRQQSALIDISSSNVEIDDSPARQASAPAPMQSTAGLFDPEDEDDDDDNDSQPF